MELFSIRFNIQTITLSACQFTSNTQIFIDNQNVFDEPTFNMNNTLPIVLNELGLCHLHFEIFPNNNMVKVEILNSDQSDTLFSEIIKTDLSQLNVDPQILIERQSKQPDNNGIKLFSAPVIGLVLKLSKTFPIVKGVLLASSAAAYSILFSWQFALILLAILIFHEYGHIYAMKFNTICRWHGCK